MNQLELVTERMPVRMACSRLTAAMLVLSEETRGVLTLWLSLAATVLVVGCAVWTGGTLRLMQVAYVLLLPHLFIGDLFHWSRFPILARAEQVLWLSLAMLGAGVFLVIRQAGSYALPLFFVYFFWHFWKDLDLAFREPAQVLTTAYVRWPKRWCGILVGLVFTVTVSGIVRDPFTVRLALGIAVVTALALLLIAGVSFVRARPSSPFLDVQWRRYAIFSGGMLLVCAWLNVLHPAARNVVPLSLVIWHFMLWYAFYGLELARTPAQARPSDAQRGLQRYQSSLPSLLGLVVVVNGIAAAGAWIYATHPTIDCLRYIYNFNYLAGGWTVMHVTWDWLPSQTKGVRLSVF